MFQVFRINTYPVEKNWFNVGRDESWTVLQDKSFGTEEEAKQYIRDKSLIHTDVCNRLLSSKDQDERNHLLDQYLFYDDRFLGFRRFFIGPPDLKKIALALRKDGVKVTV